MEIGWLCHKDYCAWISSFVLSVREQVLDEVTNLIEKAIMLALPEMEYSLNDATHEINETLLFRNVLFHEKTLFLILVGSSLYQK